MYAPAACLRQLEHHLECCCCFMDIQTTLSTYICYHINKIIYQYIHTKSSILQYMQSHCGRGGYASIKNCSKRQPISRTLPVTLLPGGRPLSVKQKQVPARILPRGVSCYLPYPLPGTAEYIFVALIVSSFFCRVWPVPPRSARVHLSCGECCPRRCTKPITLPWILLPPPALACTTRVPFCIATAQLLVSTPKIPGFSPAE